jgi:hypothetical protein
MWIPATSVFVRPCSEPVQYDVNAHDVLEPSVPGLQMKISDEPPLTPETENAPNVLR